MTGESGNPDNSGGRMERGWRLTKAAWALIRQDPTMVALALGGALFAIIGSAIILYFGGYFTGAAHSRAHLGLVALIALYPLTFIGVFFNVALAAAAGANLDGHPLTLGEALGEARARLPAIALWTLLAVAVGVILSEIAARIPLAGRIVVWLFGAAWGVATMFAIPLMALEDAGPLEAIKGSGHLIKSRWGEGISGVVGITLWTVFIAIPAALVLEIGSGLERNGRSGGPVLILIGFTALVVIGAIAGATRQVFAVALFRYATDAPTGGFPAADLAHPFKTKDEARARRGRVSRWILWGVVGIFALLVLIAIVHPKRHDQGAPETNVPLTHPDGIFDASFTSSPDVERAVKNGMPIYYGDERIGTVISNFVDGGAEYAHAAISPLYRDLPRGLIELEANASPPRIEITPPGA